MGFVPADACSVLAGLTLYADLCRRALSVCQRSMQAAAVQPKAREIFRPMPQRVPLMWDLHYKKCIYARDS